MPFCKPTFRAGGGEFEERGHDKWASTSTPPKSSALFTTTNNFDFYDCYTSDDSGDYDDADADDGNENKNVFRAGEFDMISGRTHQRHQKVGLPRLLH